MPMKQLSRTVVFVDTNPKTNRIGVLKDLNAISQLDDDDTNVFQKSLIDRYEHRPNTLDQMCLAEFAANYVTSYKCEENDDVLPNDETVELCENSKIKLKDGYGTMYRYRREAVIRFTRFNKDKESNNYYCAKLMLWRNEDIDVLVNYETYEERYNHVHVQDVVIDNESKYNEIPDNNAEYNENGPPEHLWAGIAPNTEENRLNALREGEEMLTNLNQDNINDNNALLTNVSSSTNILQRYESACNTDVLSPEEY